MEIKETALKYGEYTYADYAGWDDEKRYELIDGFVYMMSSPSEAHQTISLELSRQLGNFLRGNPCKAFVAPFDVCLFGKGDSDTTVVQPDLLIVCDKSKLDGRRCNGAPDMVVEILSPSTASKDRLLKFKKYLEAGVKEYWIVDPAYMTVTVNILSDGVYTGQMYGIIDEDGKTIEDSELPVHILDGCVIKLNDIFDEGI